jgi:hypothetical protein
MYLDIQKGLALEKLSNGEIKGRWKRFVSRWNRGELAEGWYDPSTLEKSRCNAEECQTPLFAGRRRGSPDYKQGCNSNLQSLPDMNFPTSAERVFNDSRGKDVEKNWDDEDEDDIYGPQLSQHDASRDPLPRSGPTIPTVQDIQLRRESALVDEQSVREDERRHHRGEVRTHKSQLRAMADEIVPRSEPGTRERRLEKRKEVTASNREFARSARDGSPMETALDTELMGGGENDLETLKKGKDKDQRKKNERDSRREEILRARAAERADRIQKYRQKEEHTMSWLKALARQKFG